MEVDLYESLQTIFNMTESNNKMLKKLMVRLELEEKEIEGDKDDQEKKK